MIFRVQVYAILSILFISSCSKVVNMDNSQIMTIVEKIASDSAASSATNLCPAVYDNGTTGGCFASTKDDVDFVEHFYSDMIKKGFIVSHPVRQDYLAWTGILLTPDKRKTVVFNIRTLVDSQPDDKFRYELYDKGYKTLCEVSINNE